MGRPVARCYDGALSPAWCSGQCADPKWLLVLVLVPLSSMLVDRANTTARVSFRFHYSAIVVALAAAAAAAPCEAAAV